MKRLQTDVEFEVVLVISDEAAVVLSDFEGVDGMGGDEGGSFLHTDTLIIGAEDQGFFGDAGFERALGVGWDWGADGEGFSVAAGGEAEVVVFDKESPASGGAALSCDHSLGGEFFELGGDGEGAVGDIG